MDWATILEIVLKALGSAAATLVITLGSILFAKLKAKITESKLTAYINEVVKAAEQLYPNAGKKMGIQKYEYVVEQVLAKFPKITDNNYLKSLIEGAVYSLSEQTKQIAKQLSTEGTENDVVESKTLTIF